MPEQNKAHDFLFVGRNRDTVDAEEDIHCLESDSLVSVEERAVLRDAEAVGSRERHEVRVGRAVETIIPNGN